MLKRSVKRPKIYDSDRMFWVLMTKMLKEWREAVHFVKPETVIAWHRRGFTYYWAPEVEGDCVLKLGMVGEFWLHCDSCNNALWNSYLR